MSGQRGPCVKRAYLSRHDAKVVARRERIRVGHRLRVYRCPHCRFFHLTSSRERLAPPARR